MRPQGAPGLEKRRAADFERELIGRARSWIPTWSLDEAEADFGLALLKIAARFNSEVAERLDRVGEKMALGFLDWLGLPAAAARPARVPVVMNLAETATEPVLAPRPTRMQADAAGATIAFETEADLQVIPGQLAAVVAVDPAKDEYYLPPPGLTSLAELAPLPTAWKLKNFAAPGAAKLQVDPGLGFVEDMLVEIEGHQFRIVAAKDDLITIEPEVPAGDGWAEGTKVEEVETFRPFDGARNLQEHILYIGDADLLNVEAAARIEIAGLGPVPDGVQWSYWGKAADAPPTDAEARWRDLHIEQDPPPTAEALVLIKPEGELETLEIGGIEGRWIRARLVTSGAPKMADKVTVRINPRPNPNVKPGEIRDNPIDWSSILRPEIFVDSTPSPPSNFYPLGQQPRIFDTLYVGSEDAFSKKGAIAWIQFDLSDAVFQSLSTIDASEINFGVIVAAVDRRGALHLLKMDSGTIRRLPNREPMRPGNVSLLPDIPPIMWMDGGDVHVAVASKSKVHVWKELHATPHDSKWEDHGSPLAGDIPGEQISGLARVNWGGPTLVAARGGKLSRKPSSNSGDPWSERSVNFSVEHIYAVHTDQTGVLPTSVIALESATSKLFHVGSAGAPNELFKINSAIRPAAIERLSTNTLDVIAVHATDDKLRARIGSSNIASGPKLRDGFSFLPGSQIEARLEGANLTAYFVAAQEDNPDRQVLSAWQPTKPEFEKILFDRDIDFGGKAGGAIAFAPGDVALLPGNNRGEIFKATFGGTRTAFDVERDDLRSALAVKPDVNLTVGHTVSCKDTGGSHFSKVSNTPKTGALNSDQSYYWLDDFVNVSTDEREVAVFDTSQPVVEVKRTSPTKVTFTTPPAPAVDYILMANAGVPSELIAISNPQADGVADAAPQTVSTGDRFDCWLPNKTIKGQFFPAVELVDDTLDADALIRGRVYSPGLIPDRQRVGAAAIDNGKPTNIALEQAWTLPLPGGTTQFALDDAIASWASVFGDSDANPTLSWEYWDGSGWTHLQVGKVDDETNNLKNSGAVRFVVPDDLQMTEWAGKENFWVRARLIAGDYGEEKTVVTIEDLGDKKSRQTIDRIPEGVQPPFALEVGVVYAMDEVAIPTFLLTRDSGSLRNQSDANRTPGALVEVFTPLSVTLGRLDVAEPMAPPLCVPDCECTTGAASTSQKVGSNDAPSTAALPSTGSRRALYLGFSSKLLGAPVNLLFLASRENNYDDIAPLRVDALIANRFRSIVSGDDTRALGETGILGMTFDVAPLKADLFGKSLSWLRVAPRVGSDDWKPAIAGIYANAVWTRSAETMTRELLGSSDGRPDLAVALARPPLLQGSLELRVREPLGKDECAALTADDPNLVKQDIEDLPGVWVLWKQVADPLDCGPSDRVYALDEETGDVRFGDGRHGAIPPVGTDSIVAFAYERIDPAAEGQVAANFVKARQEINLVSPVEGVEAVIAADRSAGGVGPERPEHVLEFAPATLRHRRRAVSLQDFEDLVRQHSAEVVQARAFNRNGRVRIVVATKGTNPAPTRAQQRELRRMLLEISPAALGARDALTIAGPRIRRLMVETGLRVSTLDVAGRVARDAKERLVARFSTEPAGENAVPWQIGRSPTEADLAETLLDIAGLDEIVSIEMFERDDLGRETPWTGEVRSSDLVMLAAEDVRVDFKLLEAAA